MPGPKRVSRRSVATVVGLLGVIVLILALVFGSREHDDDDASASGQSPAARAPDDASKRRPIDSGKRMLDANKASASGTIRDAEGNPIAGASVCAQANQDELLGAGDRLPQCSTSERDGHYRLDGLWPVSTSINAGAPQFIPARWSERVAGRERYELRLHAGEERRGIDITLERGGVPIRGVVKDIGGGVVEDALVTSTSGFWSSGQALAVGRTDAEGRFELWTKPGRTSLTAHAEGYAPASTDSSAPTELAMIFMTPESVLGGMVVHAETGEPAAGVTVRANSGGGFAMGGRGNETITDADGRFRIASLPPGIYDLKAQADELYGEGVEQVHLGLSQSIDDIVVEVHPAFAVAGKVVIAETDAPCTEGEVLLAHDGQQVRGRVDEHGEALMRALLPGTYQVQVNCTGHVSEPEYEPIVVADQNLIELEWKVHTGLAIRGVVVDSGAAPVVGVTVMASPKTAPGDPRGPQTWGWNTATDSDGSFDLQGLLPGTYELDVWSNTHPKLAEPEVVTLGEAADVDNVRLVLPATGRLVGIVRDETGTAASGVSVSAASLTGGRQWSQTSARAGDDGRFEIERLEAGSFRVRAGRRAPGTTDDDLQGEVVEITPGGETQIELVVESRTMSIRGRVVDSGGAPVFDAFVDAVRMSDSAAAGPTNLASARWGWDRKPQLSDQDGNFEVAELAEGEYIVRAYRKGGGEGLLENVAAGSTGVVLTIGDTGQLAGKVVLADRGSPDRFEILVTDRAQGVDRRDDFFRTDGSFVIRELSPGTYEVRVTAAEGSAKTEVVLEAGQSIDDLQLELTSKVTVEGRLVDADTQAPVPGMAVRISAPGGRFAFDPNSSKPDHISDADGRFRVEGVQVGKVRARITPRSFGSGDHAYASTGRDLHLPSEPAVQNIGEIELLASRLPGDQKTGELGYTLMRLAPELELEDRYFEVAVIRPSGPAENTGLAVGDRIVEVDGRSVVGLDAHRYYTLTIAPPGTSIVLGIEGGKQVTIVLGQPVE